MSAVDVAPIFSAFQDEEDFRELLEDFFVSAQDRRRVLSQLLADREWHAIRKQAHQLKGSGGGYGFDGLSELAAQLEEVCSQSEPTLEEISPLLDDVVDYLSRIRI